MLVEEERGRIRERREYYGKAGVNLGIQKRILN